MIVRGAAPRRSAAAAPATSSGVRSGGTAAAAIVSEREQHGPFVSVGDLLRVPGIGPATLDQLRDAVRERFGADALKPATLVDPAADSENADT